MDPILLYMLYIVGIEGIIVLIAVIFLVKELIGVTLKVKDIVDRAKSLSYEAESAIMPAISAMKTTMSIPSAFLSIFLGKGKGASEAEVDVKYKK